MRSVLRCCSRRKFGLLVGAIGLPAHALDGASLAHMVHNRPSGRDVSTASRMELTDKSGTRRVRELVTYRLERGKADHANLVRFLGPADIAGVGLLSLDKPDGSNEQWLYLPELDRVRRVAGDRKGGRFVGSDLYYEDLQTRQPASDHHRIVGRESIAGVSCDLLESIPVEASNSVYKKRLSWVDSVTALVWRVDYFEKSDTVPSKRWLLLARRDVQGYATVVDSKTVELTTGHETRLVVESIKYDRKLPHRLFTTQVLADDSLEERYRP